MKIPILFLLTFSGAFLLQAYSPTSLNDLSSNPAEKPYTVSGSFAGYNPAADPFRSNLFFHRYSDTTSERFFRQVDGPLQGKGSVH